MTTDNMSIYNRLRAVPPEAKKTIGAGRLKGFTDVNPMWRLKSLTEVFGPCGVGWWYDITDKRIEHDEITNQKAAFVDILLYYVDPVSGHESHGIPGTGGSVFVAKEANGPRLSDECFKMALTDAISVAAKALGCAADVYYDKDRTKYTVSEPEAKKPIVEDDKTKPVICPKCGRQILREKLKGKLREPEEILSACDGVCLTCWKEQKTNESDHQ